MKDEAEEETRTVQRPNKRLSFGMGEKSIIIWIKKVKECFMPPLGNACPTTYYSVWASSIFSS